MNMKMIVEKMWHFKKKRAYLTRKRGALLRRHTKMKCKIEMKNKSIDEGKNFIVILGSVIISLILFVYINIRKIIN